MRVWSDSFTRKRICCCSQDQWSSSPVGIATLFAIEQAVGQSLEAAIEVGAEHTAKSARSPAEVDSLRQGFYEMAGKGTLLLGAAGIAKVMKEKGTGSVGVKPDAKPKVARDDWGVGGRTKSLEFDYSSHGAPYSLRIDPRAGTGPLHVDMTGMKPVDGVTKYGHPRNAKEFWKVFDQKYPGALSERNVGAIQGKFDAPMVDKQWLQHFPEHQKFLGQKLEHHHLDHGALAYPLPKDLHRGAGNTKVWHE